MQLTRRNLLTGAAAIGAAAVAPATAYSPARAAAPPLGAQAPGFYRYKVGSFECTSINDGARTFPMPDTFVKNVPKEQALAAAEAAYMPKGMVTVPFNPQLINTGSKLVLIDCGNGVASSNRARARSAARSANLAAAGVDPKSHRRRADVAPASRPHQRHPRRRRLDGVSERGDHGARRRTGNSG